MGVLVPGVHAELPEKYLMGQTIIVSRRDVYIDILLPYSYTLEAGVDWIFEILCIIYYTLSKIICYIVVLKVLKLVIFSFENSLLLVWDGTKHLCITDIV